MFIKVFTTASLLFAFVGAFNLNVPADFPNELTDQLGGAFDPNQVVEEFLSICHNETGIDIRSQIQTALLATQTCISSKVKLDTLRQEIMTAVENKKGELDDVFKSRCDMIPAFKDCRKDLVDTVKLCFKKQHREDLDTLIKAVDAGLDFVCYNGGERLALFMAEGGEKCFQSQFENVISCVNSTSPLAESVFKEMENDRNRTLFTDDACKLDAKVQSCLEENLNKCKDPTPANLVNALMKSMTKVTPCFKSSASASVFDIFTLLIALVICFLSRKS